MSADTFTVWHRRHYSRRWERVATVRTHAEAVRLIGSGGDWAIREGNERPTSKPDESPNLFTGIAVDG